MQPKSPNLSINTAQLRWARTQQPAAVGPIMSVVRHLSNIPFSANPKKGLPMNLGFTEVAMLGFFTIIIPLWIILRKAGFHPAWSLLGLIPGVNFIAVWVFALLPWPVHRRDA